MIFFKDFYARIIAFVEDNWFGIAQSIRLLMLFLAVIAVLFFGLTSFRACDLNWGVL